MTSKVSFPLNQKKMHELISLLGVSLRKRQHFYKEKTIGVISIFLRFVQKCERTLPAVNIRKNTENSMIVAYFVMNGF